LLLLLFRVSSVTIPQVVALSTAKKIVGCRPDIPLGFWVG
jgi:hypothetical protein